MRKFMRRIRKFMRAVLDPKSSSGAARTCQIARQIRALISSMFGAASGRGRRIASTCLAGRPKVHTESFGPGWLEDVGTLSWAQRRQHMSLRSNRQRKHGSGRKRLDQNRCTEPAIKPHRALQQSAAFYYPGLPAEQKGCEFPNPSHEKICLRRQPELGSTTLGSPCPIYIPNMAFEGTM